MKVRTMAATAAFIAAVTAAILTGMGRPLWCSCGQSSLWSSDIWAEHNSQHSFDPYSFTHVMHGLMFYAILAFVFRKKWPRARYLIAVALEGSWEVLENSSFIIDKYRESTVALGYYGDSMVNSMSDLLACSFGYAIAAFAPVYLSAGIFVLSETILAIVIRDNLILNIIILTWPIESIKAWQLGGQ